MSLIANSGDPLFPIWVVTGDPYENDSDSGVIFGGGYGWNWKKTWKLSRLPEPYICSIRPCLGATYDDPNILFNLVHKLDQYKPTFIILLTDQLLNYFIPRTTQIKEKNSSIRKWAGSLLTCDFIRYPHYIFGCQPPDYITRNWDEHEIIGTIDLGHVFDEYTYWRQYGTINPLPNRQLLVNPSFTDIISFLNDCLSLPIISRDIETIRPKKGNKTENHTFYAQQEHPGYPYCEAIATSPKMAMSFSYWDYRPEDCIKIWRLLGQILKTVPQIGQNYFTFDSHYTERMGFRMCLDKCKDTMIRHHILWSCLPHSLQFQTKQYTREPFYKDEGKGFRLAEKNKYMIYNAKDAAVTYEIYNEQEKEFDSRPQCR